MKYRNTAPTEALELELIEHCINNLNLQIGEFWYWWFPSSSVNTTRNHTIKICTDNGKLLEPIIKSINKLSFIEKVHKGGFNVVNLGRMIADWDKFDRKKNDAYEFDFHYSVHFKMKEDEKVSD